MWVDGEFVAAEGFERLERFREHTIDVVVGDVSAKTPNAEVREIVRRAVEIGKGTARLHHARGELTVLSTEMSCPSCGHAFEELDPRLFSYNSPHGWCEGCRGFGVVWASNAYRPKIDDDASQIERELAEERASEWAEEGEEKPCPRCHGARLNATARNVRLTQTAAAPVAAAAKNGRRKEAANGGSGAPFTIDHLARMPVREALVRMETLEFHDAQEIIAKDVVSEIRQRLLFMEEVGLGYLTLDRSAKTLSGGETQRIRLAAQLGSNLRGVLYVLDEPTIGLHPRDNARLLDTLEALKAKGNSLVIVEHDDETMRRADFILDLGPGPGVHGGEVVASGTLAEIQANPQSVTGRCLKDPLDHPMLGQRRKLVPAEKGGPWIEVVGASPNNLRAVDARFPVGRLSVITGISGSGKSSLMRSALCRPRRKRSRKRRPANARAPRRRRGGNFAARNFSTPCMRWTSRRSARPRARRRRRMSACSTKSARSSPRCRWRGCAATRRAGFRSTPRAAAARPAAAWA